MSHKFIEIPVKYLEVLGKTDAGTRIYRTKGTDIDYRKWFDTVIEITKGKIVSPGGVPMYCRVSRAGLHKKLKTGGITAFCFHFTKFEKCLFSKKEREAIEKYSYMYFPIYELEQWEDELLTKLEIKKYDNEGFRELPKDHELRKGRKVVFYSLEDLKPKWEKEEKK